MSLSTEVKFPPLTFTNNNLFDVIQFIKDKNVIALHTERACRVFHSLSFEQPETKASLQNVRVIYLDCNKLTGLLEDGEWEWYIKQAIQDVKELGLKSELRKIIIEQKEVPNKAYLSLGGF